MKKLDAIPNEKQLRVREMSTGQETLAYGNIVHDEKWDGKIKEADNGND